MMRIVYLKTHDGNKPGTDKFTETSLARRLCRRGWAIPYMDWQNQQEEKKEKPEPKKKPKTRTRKTEKAVRVK